MLSPANLEDLQSILNHLQIDGWLLFDFHGANPIAASILNLEGIVTRRVFAYVPASGNPVAITSAIEQGPWQHWPGSWRREIYTTWQSLEAHLRRELSGKTVAMEYCPGNAVPYLDRVPAGALEFVTRAGASVVSSAEIVTRFYAVWDSEGLASHTRASLLIADIAKRAFKRVQENHQLGITEYELQQWISAELQVAGLTSEHSPIVALGSNAADPHYEPRPDSPLIRGNELLLIDLWGKEANGIYADQTWMASLGDPKPEDVDVWTAIREARDAAIMLLQDRVGRNEPVHGWEVDAAARAVIERRGYGEYFVHKTGHSIDPRALHGSGPHLDNYETKEERLLIKGVGFSIEPGIYIPGRVGARTEVNAHIGEDLLITPGDFQKDLLILHLE